MSEHHLMVVLVTIVGLGVASQWLAWRVRLPAFVIFSLAGPAAGPGLGLLDPDAALESVRFHSPDAEIEPGAGDIVVHYGPASPAAQPAAVTAALAVE